MLSRTELPVRGGRRTFCSAGTVVHQRKFPAATVLYPLQHCFAATDDPGVLSVRTGRRYRWRLAGGRLIADDACLRFVPNWLERRRGGTYWECRREDLLRVRRTGKIWLVLETAAGAETFRVFRAATVLTRLNEAVGAQPTATI
jgi:hypothetical protein